MSKFDFRKKEYIRKTKLLVLNLKLLPFMSYKNATEFYCKIKEEYKEVYCIFFDYFEQTWLDPDDEDKSRYPFCLWKYEGKIDLESSRSELLISKKVPRIIFFYLIMHVSL